MTKSRHSLKAMEDGGNGEKKTNKTSVHRTHCLPCPVSHRSLCPFAQQMGDSEGEEGGKTRNENRREDLYQNPTARILHHRHSDRLPGNEIHNGERHCAGLSG